MKTRTTGKPGTTGRAASAADPGSRGRRLLVVTPLDWDEQRGNLEHHRAAEYARRGWRVTVLHKRMNRSRRLRDLLVDSLTCRFRVGDEGGVRLVGVDPFFNYFAGLRRDAEERAPAGGRPAGGLLWLRRLTPLAALRDLFVVPCFLLAAALRRERYDACLAFGPWGGAVGWLLRALGRVSVLVYEDRDWEPGLVPDRLRRGYTAALERFGIRRADVVVSIGELLAERRRRETGREPAILPSGVHVERYAAARAAPREAERLIYVGNLIAWSGVERALRSLPRLAELRPAVSLVVVGDGLPGYVAKLERLARELGVEERVRFLGRRPPAELPALLAAAEVGLAASEPVSFRRYASPLKLMEYLAAGLPVVTTAGTEAALVAARAGAGVAVPWPAARPDLGAGADADALVPALAELLADRERRGELGRSGAAFARSVDWRVLVDRELALFEPLLPPAAEPVAAPRTEGAS